jgi:hypothetical protein
MQLFAVHLPLPLRSLSVRPPNIFLSHVFSSLCSCLTVVDKSSRLSKRQKTCSTVYFNLRMFRYERGIPKNLKHFLKLVCCSFLCGCCLDSLVSFQIVPMFWNLNTFSGGEAPYSQSLPSGAQIR